MIQIYDHTIGETIISEMTNEEQAKRNVEVATSIAQKEAKKQTEAEARALKISAYEKLGLTEAEIEVLLPTPKPPLLP